MQVKFEMSKRDAAHLVPLLNIELRNMRLTIECAEALNKAFRAMTGGDHESMQIRRRKVKKCEQTVKSCCLP